MQFIFPLVFQFLFSLTKDLSKLLLMYSYCQLFLKICRNLHKRRPNKKNPKSRKNQSSSHFQGRSTLWRVDWITIYAFSVLFWSFYIKILFFFSYYYYFFVTFTFCPRGKRMVVIRPFIYIYIYTYYCCITVKLKTLGFDWK